MTISTTCGECGANYQVNDAHAGRQFKCKACGASVRVPAAQDDAHEFEADAPDEFAEARPKRRRRPPPAASPGRSARKPPSKPTGKPPGRRSPGGRERGPRRKPPQKKKGGVPKVVWIVGGGGLTMVIVGVVVIGLIVNSARKAARKIAESDPKEFVDMLGKLAEEEAKRNAGRAGGGVNRTPSETPSRIPRDFNPDDLPEEQFTLDELLVLKPDGHFPRLKGEIRRIAFSPDGKTLASLLQRGGLDGSSWIETWNVQTHEKVGEMKLAKKVGKKLTAYIGEIAYTPDGRTIICAGSSGLHSVRVVDSTSLTDLRQFDDFQGYNEALVSDGKMIAGVMGDDEEDIALLDLTSGKTRTLAKRGANRVRAMRSNADGTLLAVGKKGFSRDDGPPFVSLWNVDSGKHIKDISLPETHDDIESMAVTIDGRFVGVRSDNGYLVFDIQADEWVTNREKSLIQAIEFLPDNQTLVLTGYSSHASVAFFDIETEQRKAAFSAPRLGDSPGDRRPAISSDGSRLAQQFSVAPFLFWNISAEHLKAKRDELLGNDDFSLTGKQFLNRFLMNPRAAHKKYVGKYVELDVTGIVDPLGGGPVIFDNVRGETQSVDSVDLRLSISDFTDYDFNHFAAPAKLLRIRARYDFISRIAINLSNATLLELGEDPTIHVTADEVTRDFDEDELAALGKYSRKPVVITGTYLKKYVDNSSGTSIPLGIELKGHQLPNGQFTSVGVRCDVKFRPLTEGQTMTLRGWCQGQDPERIFFMGGKFVDE